MRIYIRSIFGLLDPSGALTPFLEKQEDRHSTSFLLLGQLSSQARLLWERQNSLEGDEGKGRLSQAAAQPRACPSVLASALERSQPRGLGGAPGPRRQAARLGSHLGCLTRGPRGLFQTPRSTGPLCPRRPPGGSAWHSDGRSYSPRPGRAGRLLLSAGGTGPGVCGP